MNLLSIICISRLEEAEERYANRESRPEDLELIEQLRSAILEKEERINALVVWCTLILYPTILFLTLYLICQF